MFFFFSKGHADLNTPDDSVLEEEVDENILASENDSTASKETSDGKGFPFNVPSFISDIVLSSPFFHDIFCYFATLFNI